MRLVSNPETDRVGDQNRNYSEGGVGVDDTQDFYGKLLARNGGGHQRGHCGGADQRCARKAQRHDVLLRKML